MYSDIIYYSLIFNDKIYKPSKWALQEKTFFEILNALICKRIYLFHNKMCFKSLVLGGGGITFVNKIKMWANNFKVLYFKEMYP